VFSTDVRGELLLERLVLGALDIPTAGQNPRCGGLQFVRERVVPALEIVQRDTAPGRFMPFSEAVGRWTAESSASRTGASVMRPPVSRPRAEINDGPSC
jgi:hypothetical protein